MDYGKIAYSHLQELKRRVTRLENAKITAKEEDCKLEYVFVTNKRKNVYWVCGLDGGLEVWKETFSGRNALQRATARYEEMTRKEEN